ncbi:MAG: hypothetical protein V4710_21615 [Verrucomicrobiota bacterium]
MTPQKNAVRVLLRPPAALHGQSLVGAERFHLSMNQKLQMRDGDAVLVIVQDGKVIHYSWNMGLPHIEFVRRTAGTLPEGAWVGAVSKLDGEVMGITSKYFYDFQLPAPPEVNAAIKATFK